ncbi:iron-binding protein [Thecaphora frezii]|nr:putative cluster assembly scaffold [Thecaphora frezii]
MFTNTLAPLARSVTLRTAQFSSVARPSVATVARTLASPVGGASTQRRCYHEKVIDHYENPRNVGSFLKTDKNVGIGLVGAPACGDVMKLSIKVNEDGIIEDVRFKTFGCGSAIASSSYMTERVKGMTLEEAGKIKNTEIAQELCLPPVKLHCSMLAEDAIKSAIKNYRSKREVTGNRAPGHIEVTQSAATGETTATAHVGSGAA